VVRLSFVVFDRDMAGLLVLGCVRVDTERSRPGRFGGGALREGEGVTGEGVAEFVCNTDDGCWDRFGWLCAGRCWASVSTQG